MQLHITMSHPHLRNGAAGHRLSLTVAFALLLLALAPAVGADAEAARAEEPVILVLGDSLSEGSGIDQQGGWVNLLVQRLSAEGKRYRVVNASIGGDTTRGGKARLPKALATHTPSVVLVELGGNDGLRGLDLEETRANLDAILRLIHDTGAKALLAEMRLPPNYGADYTEKFRSVFHDLARSRDARLIPFLLEGIAGRPELMQADGIHPRAEAQARILENVWPHLEPLL